MPQMGYEMVSGTIVRWLKAEGDAVHAGDVIAEVETDKALVELEANADGVLLGLAPAGSLALVGGVIGYVGAAGETAPDSLGPTPAVRERSVSPIAARLANDRGMDVDAIVGTGPGGRVTKADVLATAERTGATPRAKGLRSGFPPRVPNAEGKIMLGPMGEAIARRTALTMATVPHFYTTRQIDMTDAMAFRQEVNKGLTGEDRVSMNDVLIRAATLTLLKYPVFNATFEGDHLRVHPHVHMGMALALPDGVMVPAVLDCDRKSLVEIARGSKDLARRAVDGTLRQAEYSGTFSISNLGMFGVDSFTAVIVAPQVGVLTVAAIKPTPMAVGGNVVVRSAMTLTLGTDHRAAPGAEAAQFLVELKRLLEDPKLLAD
jgi:pyruvate dehydrogenase E2 component (dihydrolipoamide acetyltransferase)